MEKTINVITAILTLTFPLVYDTTVCQRVFLSASDVHGVKEKNRGKIKNHKKSWSVNKFCVTWWSWDWFLKMLIVYFHMLLFLTWYQVCGIVATGLWPRCSHSSISVNVETELSWPVTCPNSGWYMHGCDTCIYEQSGSLNLMDVEVLEYKLNGYMSLWDEIVWKILRYSLMRLAMLDRNTLEHSSAGGCQKVSVSVSDVPGEKRK